MKFSEIKSVKDLLNWIFATEQKPVPKAKSKKKKKKKGAKKS